MKLFTAVDTDCRGRNEGYCVKPDSDKFDDFCFYGVFFLVFSATLYKIDWLQRSECLGHRRGVLQVQVEDEATGNQMMSLGCPVQGSLRTGCNTGSTGSGSGSTAATAGRTGGREQGD